MPPRLQSYACDDLTAIIRCGWLSSFTRDHCAESCAYFGREQGAATRRDNAKDFKNGKQGNEANNLEGPRHPWAYQKNTQTLATWSFPDPPCIICIVLLAHVAVACVIVGLLLRDAMTAEAQSAMTQSTSLGTVCWCRASTPFCLRSIGEVIAHTW